MRDTFYHWLTVALMFAMQFGAAIQRAVDGHHGWSELAAFGAAMILAMVGLVDHYRSKEKPEGN